MRRNRGQPALVGRLCRDLAAEGRRILTMDLPGLWSDDTAVLMVRQLP